MALRLWHQSITDLAELPRFEAALVAHAESVCDPGTIVDMHGLAAGTYPAGIAPIEMGRYRWAHHMFGIQIVESALRAEREGYDAFVLACFMDPALDEVRSMVDIPVVASCEGSLLLSSTIGRAPAMITIGKRSVHSLRGLVRRYGYADRVVSITAMNPPFTEYDIEAAFAGQGDLVERFVAHARTQIEAGADVIIPSEGVMNLALVRNGLRTIDGIPVLDTLGSLFAFGEMLAKLQQRSGLATGRGFAYARPPEHVVDHLREITTTSLEAGRAQRAAGATP